MLTDLLHRYVPNARWRNLAGVASKTFHTDFHILAEEDSSEVNFWCGLLYSPFANIRLISLEGCSKQQEFLHQDLAQNGQTSSPASSLLLVKHAYSQFLDGTVGDAPMQVSGGLWATKASHLWVPIPNIHFSVGWVQFAHWGMVSLQSSADLLYRAEEAATPYGCYHWVRFLLSAPPFSSDAMPSQSYIGFKKDVILALTLFLLLCER